MNLLEAIFCNQHYELKQKGKEVSARQNSILLTTICIALLISSIFLILLLLFPSFSDLFEDTLESVFGRNIGRAAGRLVTFLPLLFAFPFVKYGMGSDDAYQKIITRFESFPLEEQERISKRGIYFFMGSLLVFAIVVAISIFS